MKNDEPFTMTIDEAIKRYIDNAEYERIHGSLQGCLDFRQLSEWLKDYNRLLEQESCEVAISKQAAIDEAFEVDTKEFGRIYVVGVDAIDSLQPVIPQQKMGCEGCIYEKTGTNSTYPCSHCSRCYTDKYKVESEE